MKTVKSSILKFAGISLVLNLLFCANVFAVHVFGGELEAQCLGNGNYRFRLTAYADCGRVSDAASNTFQIYKGIDNSLYTTVNLTRVSADTLPVIQNKCATGVKGTCVARVVLEGTANLPMIQGGYVLAYGSCCRNQNITNIVNPGSTAQIYTLKLPGTELVTTCNSAPTFNALPPSEICTNMPMEIDFSATDADGDELRYRLINPLGQGSGSYTPPFPKVNFSSPYTYQDPINSGIQIDSTTGIITGTPKNIGLFVIGVAVEEYRNGKLIGTKIRDFTYTIIACTPQLSTNNPTVATCANLPVQFDYNFSGPLKAGTTPQWNFGDPGSGANNFSTIKNPTHQYPTLGTYYATVSLVDFCGNSLRDTVRVDIVETKANVADPGQHCKGDLVTLTSTDASCSGMSWFADATTTTALTTGCTHSFTLNSDSQCVYFEPFVDPVVRTVGANGYQTWGTDATNTASFDAIVPITIDGFSLNGDQYWSGCVKFNATITVEQAGVVVAGPITKTVNCDGTTATVLTGLNLKVPQGTGYSLKISGATLKPTTGFTPVNQLGLINVNSSGPFYNWKVQSDQKCAVRDKICVKSNCPCPNTTLKFPAPICSDVDFDLNTLKTNTTSPGKWSIINAPVGGTAAVINGTKFNASKNGKGGQYTLLYTLDGGPYPNCADSNTRVITINPKDTAKITLGQGPFCLSDGVQTLKLENISSAGKWSGTGIIDANTGKFDPVDAGVGAHVITYTTNGICFVKDTLTVVVVAQKFSNIITPDTAVCNNAAPFKIRTSANTTLGGTWVSVPAGLVNASGIFDATKGVPGGPYKVYYIIQGATLACSAIDSVAITINDIDVANITPNQGPFCIMDLPTQLNLDAGSHSGQWSGTGVSATGIFTPSVAGANKTVVTYTTDGACKIIDTVQILVHAKKISNILTSDTTVCKNSANFPIRLSGNTSAGGMWLENLLPTTSTFNPTIATAAAHKIYYAVQGFNLACSAVDSVLVTVNPNADASITTPLKLDFCPDDASITLTSTVQPSTGKWWSVPAGAVNSNGVFTPKNASIGKTKVYYGIAQMCGDTGVVELTVHGVKDPTITPFGPLCESELPYTMKAKDVGTWTIDDVAINGLFSPGTLQAGFHKVINTINDFCPVADTIEVEVKATPITNLDVDTLFGCVPLSVNFTDISDSTAIASKWYIQLNGTNVDSLTGLQNVNYNFSGAGCYDVVLNNQYKYNCRSTQKFPQQICTESRPLADFTWEDLIMTVLDPWVHLLNQSSNAYTYEWKMPEGDPNVSSDENTWTKYITEVQDTFPVTLIAHNTWCLDSITKNVIIKDIFAVHVPNAFTPNGDGKNDVFYPTGWNITGEKYEFMVFNRWGELIFRTNTPMEGWNGKRDNNLRDAQVDVYVWKLIVLDTFKDKKETLVGTVSLIR